MHLDQVPGPVPLSASPIWHRLHTSYASGDTDAWQKGSIPTHITSNAALAHRYSRVLLGWLRDLAATGQPPAAEPLRILELGCGTGRFTFHMLRALEELGKSPAMARLNWKYLATDISQERLEQLAETRALKPFVQDGRLEIVRYDAFAPESLPAEGSQGPLAVIANYVLDSLPMDCFRLHAGRLLETRMQIHEDGAGDGLKALRWEFSHHPIELPHYRDPILDQLLEWCITRQKPGSILLPIGAIRALRNLGKWTAGPQLLLVGDKPAPEISDPARETMPHIELHGPSYFSMSLDFELLRALVEQQGGEMRLSSHGQEVIEFGAAMTGAKKADYPETRLAFDEQFEKNSFTAELYLSARLREQAHLLTLHDFLACLRVAHFDPYQWSSTFPLFLRQASSVPEELREELMHVLDEMALRCYPLAGSGVPEGGLDMAFLLGCTYLHLGAHAKARQLLATSVAEFGERPAAAFLMGRADFHLGDRAGGAAASRAALQEDPDLGRFLERLGLLPSGAEQAQHQAEAMEWAAALPR